MRHLKIQYITSFFLIICILAGCNTKSRESNPNPGLSINTETTPNKFVETDSVSNEIVQIENLLNALAPITDYSLLRKIDNFYSIAIPAALSSKAENVHEQLSTIEDEIILLLNAIIDAEVPEGYAIQDNWTALSATCLSLKNNISKALKALNDRDSSLVMDLRENIGNTNVVERALVIENVLSEKLLTLQEKKENLGIEIKYDYSECKAKATKYARYHFDNPKITEDDITGDKTPTVLDNVPGKHYAFTLKEHNKVIILINVKDCSIICREVTSDGYMDTYGIILPAESDDLAMPDIIGMDFEEALALLDSLGIKYKSDSVIDTDRVPAGTVAHTYPSAGKAIPEGYTVNIMMEIDTETSTSTNNNTSSNIEIEISKILADGIWCIEDSYYIYDHDHAMFSFLAIDNNNMYSGNFPGECGPSWKITKVTENGNSKYTITIHCEGEFLDREIQIINGSFIFTDFPEVKYTHMGKTLDDAEQNIVKRFPNN